MFSNILKEDWISRGDWWKVVTEVEKCTMEHSYYHLHHSSAPAVLDLRDRQIMRENVGEL